MNITKHLDWSDRAERALAPTLTTERDSIVADVQAGRVELWEIDAGACWLVTCVTAGELVVCCVQGRGLLPLSDYLVGIARRQGLRRIRWFTERPALARMLKHLKPKLAGYVYHVDLEAVH